MSYLHKLEINSNPKKINYRDLMIFIVPILIFFMYLFIYNPGILTTESFNQLHQIATGEFNNGQPFFHTFIEMIFLKIFGSPLYIAIFQILVFSTIWTVICKYHRDDSSESSNQFIAQFIVTLIICLIPINAVYSITLWKEILFSYALLFLCFLIKMMIDKQGQIDLKFAIIMAVTIAITSQLSPHGLLIGVISLIVITLYLFRKNRDNKIFLILPAIAIVCILLIASLNVIYDVDDVQKSGTHDLKTKAMVFGITRNANWDGQVYYIFEDGAHLKEARDKYFKDINQTPKESYESLTSPKLGQHNYNAVNSYALAFKNNTVLDTLFNSPALYMYLAIILLGFMYYITRSKELFLVYVPNLLNIIGVLITSPLNENRFLYGNLLVFYLLTIIFIGIWFKTDKTALPVNLNANKTTKKQESPENITNPYGSPYEPDDDYMNSIESELEDLTLDEINSMLDRPIQEEEIPMDNTIQKELQSTDSEEETSSELVDQILKEIEMEKQDK